MTELSTNNGLNGKRLYPIDSVKYLGVKIDSKLNWKSHGIRPLLQN